MKAFFSKFSKVDWVSFASCVALFALTLIPIFFDVSTTGGWLRAALISLVALTISTVVLAQISARESDKVLAGNVRTLQSLVSSAVDQNAVHEIPAGHIRHVLDEMLGSSKEWYFRGGSARWQRECVLPGLAQVTDRPVQYKVQVISPFESDLCDKYAVYRRKSRPDDERADPVRIQMELLAFIYAAVVWASRSKIVPHITLLHRFSPFRLDGNSESFLITVADPKCNGLRTKAGNWYHASLLDEFEFEAGYATPLTLPMEASDAEGVADVKQFFQRIRELNHDATVNWKEDYTDEEWGKIYDFAGTSNAESAGAI
ncbi:hypothetical protein DDA93_09780 [Arthrobacter sp. Bz4]|nr:hypothetical protein DDA93_09780 [Arthrobacter sp. Bz4]